jgi:hypothetical protein
VSSIRIFDKTGVQIAEVDAVCNRSWLLNDVGKASFTLSIFDAKCRRDVLEFGNLVLIEHEKLPAWGGVIDTPRVWGQGTVTINAYSAEQLFKYRIGLQDQKVTGTTAILLRKVLEIAQNHGWLPVSAGIIEDDGIQREETINPTDLLDELKRICERAGGDFMMQPALDANGRLYFVLNYYRSLRLDTQYVLKEGHNIALANRALSEQGEIINELLGYGDGVSWSSKPVYTGRNDASIAYYGLRQGSEYFQGVTQVGSVQKNVEAQLAVKAYPRTTLDLQALDVGETWLNCRLGAVFAVELHSAGFYGTDIGYIGTARVYGMEFDEMRQTVRIIGEQE